MFDDDHWLTSGGTVTRRYTSQSAAETTRLGERLGRKLRGGEVVLLCGDLGAGKTQFAKGVGVALGVRAEIVSPTFTLAVHYQGDLPLVHYDLYRLEEERELREVGFLDEDDPRVVSLVEWADRVVVPGRCFRVDIHVEADGSRVLEIDGPDLET